MKKVISMVAILLSVVCASAQTKQDQKLAKKNAKELAKAGWQAQSSKGIEAALVDMYAHMSEGDFDEYVADGFNNKGSIGAAKAKARNYAINEYVEYSKSIVKARITSEITDVAESEAENYIAGYERLVVKGLEEKVFSTPELVIYKQNGKHFDVRCYYLIDNNVAQRVVRNAMQQAAEESGLAHKHAEGISSFINSGLEDLSNFGK